MNTKANMVKTKASMLKTEAGRMMPLGQKKGQASKEPEVDSESHPSRAPARRARGRSQRKIEELEFLQQAKITKTKMVETKVAES